MSVLKGKNVNDVKKRRVRDERLEVKQNLSKKTDSTVLKQTVNKKQASNTDVISRGMEIQSRLKELQHLQNSKIMLNVKGWVVQWKPVKSLCLKILNHSLQGQQSLVNIVV